MTQEITIRQGIQDDLIDVMALVKELAVFENEPEAVTSSLNDYESALSEGRIDVLVAEHNNTVIGMAIFYDTFSTWKGRMLYLEDFYVKPEYRSLGIGSQLFDKVADIAKEKNCALLKWQVLDWNERAIKFYENKGAEIDKTWYNGRLWFNK